MKHKIYFLYLTAFIYANASDYEISEVKFRANVLCQEANYSNELAACCASTACMVSVVICCPNAVEFLEELPEIAPTCINYTCIATSVGALYHWMRSSILSNRSEILHEIIADSERVDRPVEIRDGLIRRNLNNPERDFDILG